MQKGFTLVELLISIAILVMMSAIAVPIYGNLQSSSQMNENTTLIVQTLKIARQNSISRVNNVSSGVKFFSNNFVIYQGTSYATRVATYDRIIPLDPSLTITSTLTNNEINFSRSLGMPSNSGTITLTHATGVVKNIVINSYGLAKEN